MEKVTPFTFADGEVEKAYRKHQDAFLLKLAPGKRVTVFFGMTNNSRVMVPVHWQEGGKGKSRRCRGEDCGDCDLGFSKQFHLYVAVYVQGSLEARAYVDVGTSLAKKWESWPPDFTKPYVIYRNDKYGPVFAECLEYNSSFSNVRPGWDIRPDLDKLFRGRTSPPSSQN